jgi:NAD(P)-dependent dehydrogenase (short-subunit alcohol dehydrogenase family)
VAPASPKAGIVGLTRALARELGPANIRVNALVPGWVMTERQQALWVTDEALAECLDEQCLKTAMPVRTSPRRRFFWRPRHSA